MTEDTKFDLDADLLEFPPEPTPEAAAAAEPAPPPQAAPVVMIEYRNRGVPPILLFPVTLILSLGMFAAYHYLFVAPRQRELQERARVEAAQVRATRAAQGADEPEPVETAAEPGPPPMGLSLESQPLPAGYEIPLPPPTFTAKELDPAAVRVAAKPVEVKAIEPAATAEAAVTPDQPPAAVDDPRKGVTPPAIGFTPPSEAPAPSVEAPVDAPKPATAIAAAEPTPGPTREDMMQALQAEAEAARAARDERNLEREQAREQVENEALDRIEAERALFHDGLKRIVASGAPTSEAGRQIDDLCDQFGRTYSNDLKAQVLAALSQYHGRVSRASEVNMLRGIGMPEAGILDYLANTLEHRRINSRNGPGTQEAVRVLAAKQLLLITPQPNSSRSAPPEALPSPPRPRDPVRRTRPASTIRTRRVR